MTGCEFQQAAGTGVMPWGIRRLAASVFILLVIAVTGCATPAGRIFPPVPNAPAYPPPPDTARITYLGKLVTDADLQPAVNGLDALGRAIFGKQDSHSMLTPIAVCTDGPIAETKDGGTGRVFVADSNAQVIHVFNFATRKYTIWKPGKSAPALEQPVALAWDAPRQRLLVSDSAAGAVLIFDATGKFQGHFGGATSFQRPVGIAVDGIGNRIFVADAKQHQILVFSPEGLLRARLGQRGTGPGQFNYPTNLALSPDGLLYVSDSLNFRIQQFDPDLHFRRAFGKKGDLPGYFAQPKGIATDLQGHLYVVDAQFENVQLFDRAGQILMDFGEEGSGPGQFWLPTAICIVPQLDGSNRLIVTDSYNRRLQFFDYHNLPEGTP